MRGIEVICVSAYETATPVHIRYALRRLRRKAPKARIVVGYWLQDDADLLQDLAEVVAPATLAATLADAVAVAQTTLQPPDGEAAPAAADAEVLAEVRQA